MQPVATGNTEVVTDGSRYAALELDSTRTLVIDTHSGHRYTVATPAGCVRRYGGGGLTAVGGGRLMWLCGVGASYPVFMNLVTRTVSVWPDLYGGLSNPTGDTAFAFTAVGRAWVAVSFGDRSGTYNNTFISIAGDRKKHDDLNPRRAINLNSPQLERPVCRGLHRRITTTDLGFGSSAPAPLPYTYQSPYGLGFLGGNDRSDLVLQRCGHQPRRLCATACVSAQLGAGIATWNEWSIIRVARVASSRTLTFRAPGPPVVVASAHTAHALFVSVPTITPGASGPFAEHWVIYTTRL